MLNRDFKEFVASFNAHAVEYQVVGGYTRAAYLPAYNTVNRRMPIPASSPASAAASAVSDTASIATSPMDSMQYKGLLGDYIGGVWGTGIAAIIGAIAFLSAYFAFKTYKVNLQQQQEDRVRDADKELLLQAQKSLQWAFQSLTDEGANIPPTAARLNWLTCARHLLRHRRLADRITSETYKLIHAEHEEYWRHKFYLALDHNALASTGYFSTGEVESWPENIELSSAMVVVDFSSWPKGSADPTDEVDRDALAKEGNAYSGRAGRGLQAYARLLERRRQSELQ